MPEPTILTYAGYENDVRRLLGLDSSSLSDEDINSLVYLGQAELYIKDDNVLPLWATYLAAGGTDKTLLQLATLHILAHHIRSSNEGFGLFPSSVKEGEAMVSFSGGSSSTKKNANGRDQLFEKAWEYILKLKGTETNVSVISTALPEYDKITGRENT